MSLCNDSKDAPDSFTNVAAGPRLRVRPARRLPHRQPSSSEKGVSRRALHHRERGPDAAHRGHISRATWCSHSITAEHRSSSEAGRSNSCPRGSSSCSQGYFSCPAGRSNPCPTEVSDLCTAGRSNSGAAGASNSRVGAHPRAAGRSNTWSAGSSDSRVRRPSSARRVGLDFLCGSGQEGPCL